MAYWAKFGLWSLFTAIAVLALPCATHEFGHWLAGRAYGLDGSLILFSGNNFAAICFDRTPNVVVLLSGGLSACLVLILMIWLSSKLKNAVYEIIAGMFCWASLVVNYIYWFYEAFGLSPAWLILFSIIGFILITERLIEYNRGLKYVHQTI